MTSVHLRGLRVVRGGNVVLDDLDLDVGAGERLALLGASGAGKSTLLRAIAGLEPVEAGRIWLGDRDVTDLRPGEREVGMVSQTATLQPHLDVHGNLSFPLRIRNVPEPERRTRVEAEARAFSLVGLLRRRPPTLSAGQRHEVALARNLVRRTEVLLVDEPFANLDPPRRLELQRELLQIQDGYGVTMILATNDQRVALGCGDRLGVLEGGRLVQVAAPTEVFRAPASTAVAGLLGDPPMDLYPGNLSRQHDGMATLAAGPLRVRTATSRVRGIDNGPVTVGIRPTAWQQDREEARRHREGARIVGTVRRSEFLGARVSVTLDAGGAAVHAIVPSPGPAVGDATELSCPASEVHLFDAVTGRALAHGL